MDRRIPLRALCLLGALLTMLQTAPALAAPVLKAVLPGRYFVRLDANTRYLDVYSNNPAAGTPIQVWDRVGGPNQIWQIIKSPDAGYYYLRSDLGRYLDVQWSGTAVGTPTLIWDFTGTDAQKWQFIEDGGKVLLRSRLGTYLQVQSEATSNGVRVVTGPNTAGRSGWQLMPAEVIPGSYMVKSGVSNRYLDVYTGNPAAGTPVQIWDRVGGPNQIWEIIPAPEASYFYVKSSLGRYLDVQWGVNTPGTPVHIWDFTGTDAQKWRITIETDGRVVMRSRLGTYLSLAGGGSTNGTRVVTASSSSSSALRWSLEPNLQPRAIHGWADLHTHPMSHLGFGKKLMHGVPDVGSLIPAGTRGCNPSDMRATSVADALGDCNSTHGGWGLDNPCGNYIRAAVLTRGLDDNFVHITSNPHGDHEHAGYPNLSFWPHQSSVIHQQMWWEWIRRAHQGGLRAIVALAVNSELLGTIINGDAPLDDRASADLQIDELRSFVARHSDFMEVALTAADLRRISSAGKLAVILGAEVDNLGNFNRSAPTADAIRAEIQRLQSRGVRYIFPVHLVDNAFGGAAVYDDLFNYANKFSFGAPYSVATASDPSITYRLSPGMLWLKPILDALSGIPYPPAFNLFTCPSGTLGCWDQFQRINALLQPDPRMAVYSTIPGGHVNSRALTSLGVVAVNEMMRLGMLVDIDHMSERSMSQTVELAEAFAPGGYPVMMGHNGIRTGTGSERSVSSTLAQRVARDGGMLGLGTADTDPLHFIQSYKTAFRTMGKRVAAIGSDVNGLERLPQSSAGLDSAAFYSGFTKSRTGLREWDYTKEGVAHYGLMWDFLRDVERQPDGAAVVGSLYDSAESLAQTWERAERLARSAAAP